MSLSLKFALTAAAAVVGSAFLTPAANASVMKDFSQYGWVAFLDDGSANGSQLDLTLLNDPSSPSTLTLSLQKLAVFGPDFTADGAVQPLSIVFRQVAANAVPRIAIEEENVFNDTGTAWHGFTFSLTGGTNGTQATFNQAASSGFSTDPFPVQNYSTDNTALTVTGGTLNSGATDNLWQPGRASGALVIDGSPFTSGSLRQEFVFKEQPVVLIPLPAAAWTSLSGLVGVGLLAGRRRVSKIFA